MHSRGPPVLRGGEEEAQHKHRQQQQGEEGVGEGEATGVTAGMLLAAEVGTDVNKVEGGEVDRWQVMSGTGGGVE